VQISTRFRSTRVVGPSSTATARPGSRAARGESIIVGCAGRRRPALVARTDSTVGVGVGVGVGAAATGARAGRRGAARFAAGRVAFAPAFGRALVATAQA
jgi:hypothetical protein